jgi:arylsulfatase/arylsulfatase A
MMHTHVTALLALTLLWLSQNQAPGAERPNVVLVMTDDQSIADFGVNGNRVILTPHINELAQQSVSFDQFYVSPVCSATRACLMTGRYNYRARVVDTWLGRSMMEPAEVTIAEVLSNAGYSTGIFGKWHLGDCYPMRPNDQGFQEALVHRGGGLAQPSDPPGNRGRYTDPILFHNGAEVQTKGFCTDVYFRASERFIDESIAQGKNFFVYLATNAPHGPYHDVPEALLAQYAAQKEELSTLLPDDAAADDRVVEDLARVAAMITNIDDNVGQLRRFLESRGLARNTLFIFLCDNGPTPRRFTGKFRGMKTEVREGGIRSPLWVHWPAALPSGSDRDEVAAHIDLMPTILEACGVEPDSSLEMDGRSLLPLLRNDSIEWPTREIVIQAHRGDVPQRRHNFMIRNQTWKLVHASGFNSKRFESSPSLELFDLAADPGEAQNLATQRPEVVARLIAAYDRWFDDVSNTRPDNYAPPRIHVGSPHEPETVLTRNEWRGADWSSRTVGSWLIHILQGGDYRVVVQVEEGAGDVTVEIGDVRRTLPSGGKSTVTYDPISLRPGDCSVTAWADGPGRRGAYQVILARVPDSDD